MFTPKERALIARLTTPLLVQRYLDALAYNYERRGETIRSFREVVRRKQAHCLEAALFAATVLEVHGYPPLLLDLESVDALDHVLFLFREGKRWGTVGRSRDPGLHGRKPVFESLRDLVKSYHAPYVDQTGRIMGYGVLDLRTLRVDWRRSPRNLWSVEDRSKRPPLHQRASQEQIEAREAARRAARETHAPQGVGAAGRWFGEASQAGRGDQDPGRQGAGEAEAA